MLNPFYTFYKKCMEIYPFFYLYEGKADRAIRKGENSVMRRNI